MSYPPPPPPPGQWRPVPPPLAPNGQPLASFVDRLLAYLLDGLILVGVALVIFLPLTVAWLAVIAGAGFQGPEAEVNVPVIVTAYLVYFGVAMIVGIILYYLYYVEYQLRRNGQTVGKKVMKLWVIPVAPGEELTRNHLVRRWLVQSLAAQFIPMLGLLDGLWQLWDKPLQQCLHDKAAQTVVVKLG